jgi:hypothetical protein
MAHSPAEIRRAIRRRIAIIAGITIGVEIGLVVMQHFGPVLETLLQPIYVIVAGVGAATIYHALRRDPEHERRRGERRKG